VTCFSTRQLGCSPRAYPLLPKQPHLGEINSAPRRYRNQRQALARRAAIGGSFARAGYRPARVPLTFAIMVSLLSERVHTRLCSKLGHGVIISLETVTKSLGVSHKIISYDAPTVCVRSDQRSDAEHLSTLSNRVRTTSTLSTGTRAITSFSGL